jgi:hypothetical protein
VNGRKGGRPVGTNRATLDAARLAGDVAGGYACEPGMPVPIPIYPYPTRDMPDAEELSLGGLWQLEWVE